METLKQEKQMLCEDKIDNTKLLKDARWKFVWNNVFFFSLIHIMSIYGIYLVFTKAMWSTIIFAYILTVMSTVGVTAGAHRLWSHRSYKVNQPLKIIILFMYTLAFQGSVHQWARDHRVHHKYSDTDADPHNSKRGFFFSHIGWLMLKKHPEVTNKGRHIDLSDIENDPLLQLQRKYYYWLVFITTLAMPISIPFLWNESFWTSFFVAVILRLTISFHCIFLINSAAHIWGDKPYDKDICSAENKAVSFFASGEGFHNYHHTFPWDCKAAELGEYQLNISWFFINMMSKIGWAYELKTVSKELIEKRVMRTGDGSHPVWGWNDKDLALQYKNAAKILN